MLVTDYKMIRVLNNAQIRQSIKTGLFSLTDLVGAYNKGKPQNVPTKQLNNYMQMPSTIELLDTLTLRENLESTKILETKKGKHAGTWAHSFIMLDLSM